MADIIALHELAGKILKDANTTLMTQRDDRSKRLFALMNEYEASPQDDKKLGLILAEYFEYCSWVAASVFDSDHPVNDRHVAAIQKNAGALAEVIPADVLPDAAAVLEKMLMDCSGCPIPDEAALCNCPRCVAERFSDVSFDGIKKLVDGRH